MNAHIWIVAAGMMVVQCAGALAAPTGPDDAPKTNPTPSDLVIELTHDDTVIDQSCTIRIAPGTIIPDANGDGVIHVKPGTSPDEPPIVISFEDGSVLWGARVGDADANPDANPSASLLTPWDKLSGTGIRIDGVPNVRILNARVHGYKVGIHASNAKSIEIANADLSDNFRQRLKSDISAEDQADWLWPHGNENHEWINNYGAAVCVERSDAPTIRNVRVRRGQNGIILDRVTNAKVYDNDCSFLSGWGLAMWRVTDSLISRNAFDYCVRGYSHGVYARGQDSAGIVVFEQSSRNTIVDNSLTHSGDGIFAFAGRDAFGRDEERLGSNDNIVIGNDCSHAVAHGIEWTFSFGNHFAGNVLTGSVGCGIWAGYCQDTLIAGNLISDNGGHWRFEGGGINIEHGANNTIIANAFSKNSVGIAFWTDEDGPTRAMPGVARNYKGCVGNVIAGNTFDGDTIGVRLTACDGARIVANTFHDVKTPLKVDDGPPNRTDGPTLEEGEAPTYEGIEYASEGTTTPVGARPKRGRDSIIMGQWGPWDFDSPMVRVANAGGGQHVIEVYGKGGVWSYEDLLTKKTTRWPVAPSENKPLKITVSGQSGVTPYDFVVRERSGFAQRVRGTVVGAWWVVHAFAWDETCDPRTDLVKWRERGQDPNAILAARVGSLNLPFGNSGPSHMKYAHVDQGRDLPNDRFGVVAYTKVRLPKGSWRFTTLSDDGVRVLVNNTPLIENWTYHGPTRDTAVYEQPDAGPDGKGVEVELAVEHFEIDGFSTLRLDIEPEIGPE
jgi:hypothetical protein